MSIYRRIFHAAHYHGGGGHDLEQWIATGGERGQRPDDVPATALYSHGYLGPDGVQRWVWEQPAPMTEGQCGMCPAVRP